MLLRWALDAKGAKVRADRLTAANRKGRAPFTCPGCGEVLVPHLGKIIAPHFAHLPGSRCPLTAPETLLHLDAKERLLELCAAAFSYERTVRLLVRCPSCHRPAPRDLADAGDGAEDEGALGPLRADVLVTRGGSPALALEVRVTHGVDARKEAALAEAKVPYAEIDARETWLTEREGAAEVACIRSGGFSPCEACAALSRTEVERAKGGETAEVAELEVYRARGLFGAVDVWAGNSSDLPNALRSFSCPSCGSSSLEIGEALARHACPGGERRPVAWSAHGGKIVALSWWRPGRRGRPGAE